MRYIALMSGGIDSPVAAYLMLKAGAEIYLLNMDNRPFGGSDELDKVDDIARRLHELYPERVKLFRAPHGLSLSSFAENCNLKYTCLLCKKAMLNLADRLCDEWDADGIVLGDSLGQVASQTLANLAGVSAGIKHPIMRPLIGFDKLDIEAIGKEIGTFDISIRRTEGCTATPKHPITKVKHEQLEKEAEDGHLLDILPKVADGVVEIAL